MKEKLAYLAGVIDSDGCIHIDRYRDQRKKDKSYQYTVRLQVGVTRKEIIDWLLEHFGGETRMYVNKSRHVNRNDMLIWRKSATEAIELVKKVRPYLVLKTPRADVAIEFEKTIMNKTECRSKKFSKEREEKMKKKALLHEQMRRLNKTGVMNVG